MKTIAQLMEDLKRETRKVLGEDIGVSRYPGIDLTDLWDVIQVLPAERQQAAFVKVLNYILGLAGREPLSVQGAPAKDASPDEWGNLISNAEGTLEKAMTHLSKEAQDAVMALVDKYVQKVAREFRATGSEGHGAIPQSNLREDVGGVSGENPFGRRMGYDPTPSGFSGPSGLLTPGDTDLTIGQWQDVFEQLLVDLWSASEHLNPKEQNKVLRKAYDSVLQVAKEAWASKTGKGHV